VAPAQAAVTDFVAQVKHAPHAKLTAASATHAATVLAPVVRHAQIARATAAYA